METRAFSGPLELRGPGGRTVHGLAVPYGAPARVMSHDFGPVTEEFRAGSVDTSYPSELLAGHPGGLRLPVGSGMLAEQSGGAYGTWRLNAGGLADHVAAMIAAGEADGLSVGFIPVDGGSSYDARARHVVRHRVVLDHVALVDRALAAYPSAKVLSLRSRAECWCGCDMPRASSGLDWPEASARIRRRLVTP